MPYCHCDAFLASLACKYNLLASDGYVYKEQYVIPLVIPIYCGDATIGDAGL